MNPILETIDILELASGDKLSISIYKFIGLLPAKKVYIQANLHGAEIVGNFVIHRLIKYLSQLDSSQLNGEIWLVPFCNPLGSNQRTHFFPTGRYNPFDGKDWNRIFWDYEQKINDLEDFARINFDLTTDEIRNKFLTKILASFQDNLTQLNRNSFVSYSNYYCYQLQSLCLDANYVIDVHSSSNEAIDYIYCFPGREKSASYFLLDYAIYLQDEQYDGDAFDEAFIKPWLALEKQFRKLGKSITFEVESWTLELGSGMQINQESVTKGFNSIINYLNYHHILNNLTPKSTKINFREKSQIKKYFIPQGGLIKILVKLGQLVKTGDVLYQIIKIKEEKIISLTAENSGIVLDINRQQSLNQGEYILSILEND
jgi:hypothetical protein